VILESLADAVDGVVVVVRRKEVEERRKPLLSSGVYGGGGCGCGCSILVSSFELLQLFKRQRLRLDTVAVSATYDDDGDSSKEHLGVMMHDFKIPFFFKDDEDKMVALLIIEKAERCGVLILDCTRVDSHFTIPNIMTMITRVLLHASELIRLCTFLLRALFFVSSSKDAILSIRSRGWRELSSDH